jgi:N-acetylglucosamine kinase-like BadF-type ATPase
LDDKTFYIIFAHNIQGHKKQQYMKIIAESSSTRTEWALCDGATIVEHAFTSGLNPFFQTRREISHAIRLELPDVFFKRRWDHIYFYCAGCANIERNKIMESSVVAQFKTPCTIESDIVGAARGLLVHKPGLACILGTGSNSCYYDGNEVVKNVRPLGFILGDEGSNANMGKIFVSDVLKGLAPKDIVKIFYEKYQISENVLIDEVYSSQIPSRELSKYAFFLHEHIDNAYVYNLVYKSLMSFFERNIISYHFKDSPISFVGSTCVMFEDILRKVADDFGAKIGKIERYSMPGLVEYHAND